MAFNNGNFGNNTQPTGEKKSWRVGKDIIGSDAKFSVGLYESAYKNPFCTLQIIASIGKDPTTGINAYEQRPPQEIPSVMLSHEMLEALIHHFTDTTHDRERDVFPNWVDPVNINESFDCGRGSKLTIQGSVAGIKIGVSNEGRGERTGTITGVQLSSGPDFASWRILLQKMYYVLMYMNNAGIDADKFSSVMASSTGMTMTASENPVPDDLPI